MYHFPLCQINRQKIIYIKDYFEKKLLMLKIVIVYVKFYYDNNFILYFFST